MVFFIQREAVQNKTFGLKYSDLVRSQDFSHLSNDHVDRLELNISAGHKLIGVGTVNIYSLLYLQVSDIHWVVRAMIMVLVYVE